MDWETVSDQEILDQLTTAELAKRLEESDEWKLVHEAMKRIYDKHQKLLQAADPSDVNTVTQLQQICKLYDEGFLPGTIKRFQEIGEFAFPEAKNRGLLTRFLEKFK